VGRNLRRDDAIGETAGDAAVDPSGSVDPDIGDIAAAALAIVDEQGSAALTMRSLGAYLGMGASSLYGKVRTKDDVAALVVMRVLDEPVERPGGAWQVQLLELARRVDTARRTHPNALALLGERIDQVAAVIRAQVSAIFSEVTLGSNGERALAAEVLSRFVLGSLFAPADTHGDADALSLNYMIDAVTRAFEATSTPEPAPRESSLVARRQASAPAPRVWSRVQ